MLPSLPRPPAWLALSLAALLLTVAAWALAGGRAQAPPAPTVGLFTSLPILWQEGGSVTDLLRGDAPPHWAQAVLADAGSVRPLDMLVEDVRGDAGGRLPLPATALLVIAQPRPLSPRENVALDAWVRGGGRVLLFADPMLTHDSPYAIGDARRPQDVVLLSPILARWGLALTFDEDQPAGERRAVLLGGAVRVNLPGRFVLAGMARECALIDRGLAARCRIGAGEVLAVADAAVLESGDPAAIPDRAAALERLISALDSKR